MLLKNFSMLLPGGCSIHLSIIQCIRWLMAFGFWRLFRLDGTCQIGHRLIGKYSMVAQCIKLICILVICSSANTNLDPFFLKFLKNGTEVSASPLSLFCTSY